MEKFVDEIDPYDAVKDAARLAAPLKTWANIGFLRGFAGVRTAIIPDGQMELPSKIFYEIAVQHFNDGDISEKELKRRSRYIDDVTAYLAEQQAHYIEAHYNRSIVGHIVDMVSAIGFASIMGGLIYVYGPFHPLPLCLITLLAVKMIFLYVSVKRMIGIAQSAFARDTHNVTLPWSCTQAAKAD